GDNPFPQLESLAIVSVRLGAAILVLADKAAQGVQGSGEVVFPPEVLRGLADELAAEAQRLLKGSASVGGPPQGMVEDADPMRGQCHLGARLRVVAVATDAEIVVGQGTLEQLRPQRLQSWHVEEAVCAALREKVLDED